MHMLENMGKFVYLCIILLLLIVYIHLFFIDFDPHDHTEMSCTKMLRNTSYPEFHCVEDCPDNGNHSAPNRNEHNTCFGKHMQSYSIIIH